MNKTEIQENLNKIDKEEIITLMVQSINEDNRELCKQANIPAEQCDQQIEQSQPSLFMMMSNVYDKMKEAGLIANI